MGLIVLIVAGALVGWLTTIVLRIEDGREIAVGIAAAITGSLIAGLIAARGSFLAGISAEALLWALLGASAAACMIGLLRRRQLR